MSVKGELVTNQRRIMLGGALVALLIWAYWSVFSTLVLRWSQVPDYSHGFFVIPFAGLLAYHRRGFMPREFRSSLYGIGLLLVGLAARTVGTLFTVEPIEQFSLLISLAGIVWALGGWAFLRWSAPVLAFLIFMIPLPYSVAVARAAQLQRITALGASYLLQALGIPAFADGNIIQTVVGPLDVAYACSGLQMMVAFLAVTYAFAVLSRYPITGKLAIFLSAIPIAVVCNILRITATGVGYQFFDNDTVRHLFHDFGGLVFVPAAVGLVFLGIFLFERSFPKKPAY